MLREKKKRIATVVASEEKKERATTNACCNVGVKYELDEQCKPLSESKKKKKSELQQQKRDILTNSKSNAKRPSDTICNIPEKNQLYPPDSSIFQHDRRSSFSNYTTRRASYDRYLMTDTALDFANGPERRASYDVSYLQTNSTLQTNDDLKTSRRGSLVQRYLILIVMILIMTGRGYFQIIGLYVISEFT